MVLKSGDVPTGESPMRPAAGATDQSPSITYSENEYVVLRGITHNAARIRSKARIKRSIYGFDGDSEYPKAARP
jgi:hypothetical protein